MAVVVAAVALHPLRRLAAVVLVLRALAAMRQEPQEVRQEQMEVLLALQVQLEQPKQI